MACKDVVEQLKRHEGFRQFPYRDTVGTLTIGYGLNLDATGLREKWATWILEDLVNELYIKLGEKLPWFVGLDEIRQGVLVNMAYNLGVAGLLKFKKTLGHIEQGDYTSASREMLNSAWASQVGHRAKELAKQMLLGAA